MTQPAREKYTSIAIGLHWLVGILILAQLVVGWYMVDLPRNTDVRKFWVNFHKSLGLTIAMFIFLRVWWRATHRPPILTGIIPDWQVSASKVSHWLLYACMIVMPVSGFIMSSYSKFGIVFWGVELPRIVAADESTREIFKAIHETTMWIMVVILVVHVLAALKHLLMDKNGVFQRMVP